QDVVRLAIAQVGDEADAAGIMLVGGVVKALAARQEGIGHGGSPRNGNVWDGSGADGWLAAAGAIGRKLARGLAFHLSAPFARPRSSRPFVVKLCWRSLDMDGRDATRP